MSFTFVAMQSIPIVSQRRISFATRTLVPTLSVHKERAYAPKSTRPVKCPILVSGLPKPRRRYGSAEAVGQFVCITRRHHQHALTYPHHAGAVDESLLFVSEPGRPLRDPPSSEDDLANPRGDRPSRARDIVGQQDPSSVVSFNRHHLTDSDSYIIAFPWGE